MKRVGLVLTMLMLVNALLMASPRQTETTVKSRMDEIEKEYNIRFVYDSSLEPDLAEPCKVLTGKTLEEKLKQLFTDSGIDWKIQKKYVVLFRQMKKTQSDQRDTLANVKPEPATLLESSRIVSNKNAGVNSTYAGSLEIPKDWIRKTPTVLGEADVLKTLQMMPGVQAGMEGFSGIYVRGGGADENLMLLDGTPLYNVSHMLGLLSVFTPEAVRDVTLYKAAFPARYGGRISSIVDVRTSDGNPEKLHGMVSAGLLSEKLHLEGPLGNENTTFLVSARGMHTFLFDPILRWSDVPFNYAFYDINAKLAHKFGNKDILSAGFYMGKDYFRYEDISKSNTRFYGHDYEPYTRLLWDESDMKLRWGNTVGNLRWRHIYNSKLFSDAVVYVNRHNMSMTDYEKNWEKSEELNYDERKTFTYTSGIFDAGVKFDFDYVPVPEHIVRFGAEYIRHVFKPSNEHVKQKNTGSNVTPRDTSYLRELTPDIYGNEMSVYIEDEMSLGEHFSLNPGIRLSVFHIGKKAYVSPEPRLAARYSFADGWAVKASYSRMSQYVHQLTSGNLDMPTDLLVPITENIKPVISNNVSLGAYYSGLKGWEFSIEGYWKNMDNVLEYKNGRVHINYSSDWENDVSIGKGRTYGAEIFVQKTEGRTTGSLAYTLARSERLFPDINDGEWFPFVYDRRHVLCLNVNQKIGRRLELTGSWNYASGNWMTVPICHSMVVTPDGEDIRYVYHFPARNNYHLPSSNRLDLGLNVYKKTKRGENIWNVGIYNAYGAKNPNWVVVDEKINPDGTTSKLVLSKRTFLLFLPSFSYTFKF